MFARTRHRNGDAEVALDVFVLSDQDIEDHTVDRIVAAVVGDDPNLLLFLTETINAAFTLLVAGGVPGQVVVKYGIEMLLKVDALRKTVSTNENVFARFRDETRNPQFAVNGWEQTRDGFHSNFGG